MDNLLLLPLSVLLGFCAGFFGHAFAMKVNFKQRTLDNKISVYDALISNWASLRRLLFVSTVQGPNLDAMNQYEALYTQSQAFLARAILVTEDTDLCRDIDALNETFYRTKWRELKLDQANEKLSEIKGEVLKLAKRMHEDVRRSAQFEWRDLCEILGVRTN